MSDVFARIISEDRQHFLELYYDGDIRENPLEYALCSVDLFHRREGCWVGSNYNWSDYKGFRDQYTESDPDLWGNTLKRRRLKEYEKRAVDSGEYNTWSNPEPPWPEPDSDYVRALKQVIRKGGVVLPVYCYEHGGITFRCSSFSDPWDSGQVGYAYMTTEQIAELGWPKGKRGRKKAAEEYIRHCVGEMAAYVNGNIYGFSIFDKDGNRVDGCGGFYASHYGEADWIKDMKGNVPEEFHPLFDEYYPGRMDHVECFRRIPPAA